MVVERFCITISFCPYSYTPTNKKLFSLIGRTLLFLEIFLKDYKVGRKLYSKQQMNKGLLTGLKEALNTGPNSTTPKQWSFETTIRVQVCKIHDPTSSIHQKITTLIKYYYAFHCRSSEK